MKIFFHLGMPKTATTFLQRRVFPQIPELNYWGRPYTLMARPWDRMFHSNYFKTIEIKEEITSLLNLKPGKNLLVSDEHFVGVPYKNFLNRSLIATRIREACPQAEAIIFIRGQRNLISSLYNQYIKSGRFTGELNKNFVSLSGAGLSKSEYIPGKTTKVNKDALYFSTISIMNADDFLYSKMLDLYHSTFKKTHVFLYEDLCENPEKVLDRLAEILQISIPSSLKVKAKTERANVKLRDHRLWEKMYANRLLNLRNGQKLIGSKLFAKLLARINHQKLTVRLNDYLDAFIVNGNYSKDNKIANLNYNLGMERYPDKYFI